MISAKKTTVVFTYSLASCVLLGAAAVHAEVCEPSADGSTCVPVACSTIPEEQCIPTVLHLDVQGGAITVVACACMDFNECHVAFGNATALPVGNCPDGQTCKMFGFDTNYDGIDDRFTAECVPLGVCCLDIDDGPIAYDMCVQADWWSCCAEGALFHRVHTGCADVQACCLSFVGTSFCADMNPFCCVDSGGRSAGPGLSLQHRGGSGSV